MKSSEYERIHVTMCKNTAVNQTIKPQKALFYLKYVYLGICLPKLMIGPIIVVLINRFNKIASIWKPIFRPHLKCVIRIYSGLSIDRLRIN